MDREYVVQYKCRKCGDIFNDWDTRFYATNLMIFQFLTNSMNICHNDVSANWIGNGTAFPATLVHFCSQEKKAPPRCFGIGDLIGVEQI